MCAGVCALLASQKVLALLKADSIRVTFLGGSGAVTLRHGHHRPAVSHQKLTEKTVVAGGRAVQRRPEGQRVSTDVHRDAVADRNDNMTRRKECEYLPAVAVWSTDIGPDANQKVHNVVVTPADSIVKGGDAFVVGLARVGHLQNSSLLS